MENKKFSLLKFHKYELSEKSMVMEMTTAQVVETSVTVNNNNSPIQDYVHPDDQTQPTFEMTLGFKPFTAFHMT